VTEQDSSASNATPNGKGRCFIPISEETMTVDVGQPYTGALSLDLTPVASLLIDLPPGTLRGMRRQQPGMNDVIAELAEAIASSGAAAGVPADAYQRFLDSTDKLERVRKQSMLLRKLSEIITETEATFEHEREQALSQVVDAVKSTAKRTGNKAVAAPFERSIRYTQQTAIKAAKTRKRNAAASEAGATANG
jgi:dsDNA-binding SOS-regulon protein